MRKEGLLRCLQRFTLAIIKPDAVQYTGEIIKIIRGAGLVIVAQKTTMLSYEQAAAFYAEHEGKDFYPELWEFMAFRPIVVMVLVSKNYNDINVVERWRKLIGDTDPSKAAEWTIRYKFGQGMPNNAVHGSSSDEAAEREARFFFAEMELYHPVEVRVLLNSGK